MSEIKPKVLCSSLYKHKQTLRTRTLSNSRPAICIELGFGFDLDSPHLDNRLSDTLPALALYYAVNKQYNHSVRDNPQLVKTRLRQWAQVFACSVRQSY
uniref:Uncharacterized protein n=1 Tax=Nelumbo nucifera TaxID=4432 RepID=A0A822YTM2_NELNU|nr:TPA_asm: hypothetical protein HUJ06_004767 [Nelumbo nucifera]